jgi:hypothetical protein
LASLATLFGIAIDQFPHQPNFQGPYNVPMSDQYVATDKRTGLEVAVTGEFPEHPQDRIRIARTTNLFARLMSTILATDNETDRRESFVAIETQLELADALIRHDNEEVQRLLQETLQKLGITPEQMREIEDEIRRRLGDLGQGGLGPELGPEQ